MTRTPEAPYVAHSATPKQELFDDAEIGTIGTYETQEEARAAIDEKTHGGSASNPDGGWMEGPQGWDYGDGYGDWRGGWGHDSPGHGLSLHLDARKRDGDDPVHDTDGPSYFPEG